MYHIYIRCTYLVSKYINLSMGIGRGMGMGIGRGRGRGMGTGMGRIDGDNNKFIESQLKRLRIMKDEKLSDQLHNYGNLKNQAQQYAIFNMLNRNNIGGGKRKNMLSRFTRKRRRCNRLKKTSRKRSCRRK